MQGIGAQEEGEGKSSKSLRQVGNKKVGRECGSELVKAEMGRERKKGTGIFLKGEIKEGERERIKGKRARKQKTGHRNRKKWPKEEQ